jgi:ribosomal protein S18 acetylase RimI-like enzyme
LRVVTSSEPISGVFTQLRPPSSITLLRVVPALREQRLVGLEYLEAVTTLLQRSRNAHPNAGLWEAADRQWSWRNERSTDNLPQLFWFDDRGQPEAAVITTESGHGVAFDPIVMPDATPDWVAHVVERGLAHAADCGFGAIELEVDREGNVMREVLFDRGFTLEEDGAVEAWLAVEARPEISALREGYRLSSRVDTMPRPHHMLSVERNHPDPESRLRQTSLYRPDLDLVVHDRRDNVAAYGLFWYDPETATGLVEPMRTEDEDQRRGLARHVLTNGLGLLADAGAERIKIVYEPGNPAASGLYLSVGFTPHRYTDIFAGGTEA